MTGLEEEAPPNSMPAAAVRWRGAGGGGGGRASVLRNDWA